MTSSEEKSGSRMMVVLPDNEDNEDEADILVIILSTRATTGGFEQVHHLGQAGEEQGAVGVHQVGPVGTHLVDCPTQLAIFF